MRVVIIGSGAGGLSTASNIRKYNKEIEIIVITKDKYVAYSPCAIPYVLSGKIKSFDEIIMHDIEYYLDKDINILTETEVIEISPTKNLIKYKRLDDTKIKELKYDYLVIATGGIPAVPPIPGVNLEGVFTVRTLEDGIKIKKWAENCEHATVIGAGLIGIEMAYGLKHLIPEVDIIEMASQVVPRSLDPEMAKIIQKYLEKLGVNVLVGKTVKKIIGEKRVNAVELNNKKINTDMVLLATGVKPNISLAKKAGIKIGKWGIKVNEKMQTSVRNIYAVGDCVEVKDFITGENTLSPLGSTAVRQAKVAAKNIIGKKCRFRPVLNAMVSRIGNLEFGSVGMTEINAKYHNIETVCGMSKALTRARYYPGAERIYVKIVCNKDGKIIGCQVIAKEGVSERIDAMSIAISQHLKCSDLCEMEFSYAPPLSTVVDPFVPACEEIVEKLQNG